MTKYIKKIDTHHHIVPPFYVDKMHQKGLYKVAGVQLPHWSPELSLELMDQHGIETAITSISAPGVYFGNINEACDLARQCNEYAATLSLKYPRRFGSFAVLPMPYTNEACHEAIYALDTLHADGIVLLGSTEGIFLGDACLDELMHELNKRNALVFVHPNIHATSETLNLSTPAFFIEFLCDTTRAAMNLMVSGTLEKYSNIRWILAHAGGFLPYIAWRISLGNLLWDTAQYAPQGFLHYIKQFYYDTALSPSPYALNALQKLVDPSHILFGTDFPFAPAPLTTLQIKTMEDQHELSTIQNNIYRENALNLFTKYQMQNEELTHPSIKNSSFIDKYIKRARQKMMIHLIEKTRQQ